MSRIGKLPVKVPAGVKATVVDNVVSVEGAKRKLTEAFNKAVVIAMEGD